MNIMFSINIAYRKEYILTEQRNCEIAEDLQECLKIQIFVCIIHVIKHIRTIVKQNGKEEMLRMMYGRTEGSFSVRQIYLNVSLSLAFYHARHENMAELAKK